VPSFLHASGGGEVLLIIFAPALILPLVISVIGHNLIGLRGQKIALPIMFGFSVFGLFLTIAVFEMEFEWVLILNILTSILSITLISICRRWWLKRAK
jgi:O-antigen/teichoic acid export membrane protein